MLVQRIHPATLTNERLETAVVIDVLRATTTAIVLLARGAGVIRVVKTPAELDRLPVAPGSGRYLVFSELDASRDTGLACVDNSPSLAEDIALDGRIPVLVTTNGTRAMAAAVLRAQAVLVAGFVNVSSMARRLAADGRPVTLLPAGDFANREVRTEDERCADALEQILLGGAPDLRSMVADCWADARVKRRIARHAHLTRDVEVALAVDRYDVIARVEASPAGDGLTLVRAG